MDMDVSAGVALENLNSKAFLLGIPSAHPEQQPAVTELLPHTLRLLIAQKFRKPCSGQSSGIAAQDSCGGHCDERPAGGGNRTHDQTRPNVDQRTDDSPLTITDHLG
jgi:hypothetical protein